MLAIIIAVYGKVSSFDYSQYGYDVETIKRVIIQEENVQYIPLEKIPTIHSIGIREEHGIKLYNTLLYMSQLGFYLSDHLDMIIAIIGAVIIPLKNYCEEIEKCNQSKDSNRKGSDIT